MTDNMEKRTELLDALFDELIDRVKYGEKVIQDGQETRVPAHASVFSAAINLLKAFPPGTTPKTPELSAALSKYQGRMKFTSKPN